ncbi:PAS domain-containing protein [Spirosoma harenae]
MSDVSPDPYPFLQGGGEMGEFIRSYDWSKTSLGTPGDWPYSLRTNISNILHTHLPALVLWGSDHICFYNDAFTPSLNLAKHPAIGKPAREIWPESWDFVGPLLERVLTTGEPVTFQDTPVTAYRNGRLEDVYWTFAYSLALNDQGEAAGVLVNCIETTKAVVERKRLIEDETKLRSILTSAPAAIGVFVGPDLIVENPNQLFIDLVGKGPDIEGKSFRRVFSDVLQEDQHFLQLLDGVLTTGQPFQASDVEVVFKGEKNKTYYFNVTFTPLFDEHGKVYGVLDVSVDVTQQVLARKKVEESEARFRALIAQAPVATGLLVGRELVIEEVNEPMTKFWGKGPNVIGKTFAELLPELESQPFIKILDEVYTTGKAYHATADRCDLVIDGQLQTFYFNFTYQPIFNDQGEVYAILNMAIDVTTEMLIQQQLRESEASLRGAIELAELGTWTIDTVTGATQLSQRYCNLLGLDNRDTSWQEMMSCVVDTDRNLVTNAFQAAQQLGSKGKFEAEYSVINAKTGKRKVIHALGQTYFDDAKKPVRIAGTVQDVTLERELQLALENLVQERTEELAATNEELTATNEELSATNEELTESTDLLIRSNENLQKFAYVASHDLQEPLRKIQQFGDLLKTYYANSTGDQLSYVNRMQSAASRMSMLIKDLLNFSRISTRRDTSNILSLTEIIDTVLTDLELVITETGAQIQIDPLPNVSGDPSQMGQLFQNLLSNALKFSRVNSSGAPTIPQIAIRYQLVAASDLPPSVKPGRFSVLYHRIDVMDNGVGFDEKYLDRIFQVFQRLHSRNEFAGTGVGLAISEKVVANHGGAITATSQLGHGATFSVYLPAERPDITS